MENIKELIKDKVDEIVEKVKADPQILSKFKEDPIKTVEELVGVDLPDDAIKAVAEAAKVKLAGTELGDKLGKIGDLLGF